MPQNSFKKYIASKSRLEKSQRPFESDLSSIDAVKVLEFGEKGDRGYIRGTLLSTGEEVRIISEHNPKYANEDLIKSVSKKVQPGGIMMLEGLRELDKFAIGVEDKYLACTSFSTLSDGSENVQGKLLNDVPLLVSNVRTDKFGAYQVYYEIDTENSIKVENTQEAVSAIKKIMNRDSSITQNGFIIRGYSKEDGVASSIQFKSTDSFIGNKPSEEKIRSKLEAFFEMEEVVTIVGGDNTDILMKASDYFYMIDREDMDVTWEIIPTIEYKQTFKVNNKTMEDQLIQRANDISRSFKVGQIAGYNIATLGIKQMTYPNGNIYNSIINLKHSDKRESLPISAISTKHSDPENDLNLLSTSTYEIDSAVTNSMLDIMEMFDEESSISISDDFDFLDQEDIRIAQKNIINPQAIIETNEIVIKSSPEEIAQDNLDFDDDLSFLKFNEEENKVEANVKEVDVDNDTNLKKYDNKIEDGISPVSKQELDNFDFDDDLSFLKVEDTSESPKNMDLSDDDFDSSLDFLKEEFSKEEYIVRDNSRGYGLVEEIFKTREEAESEALSRSAMSGGEYIVEIATSDIIAEINNTKKEQENTAPPETINKKRKPRSTPIDKITDDHWIMIQQNGNFLNKNSKIIQVLSPADTAPPFNYGANYAIRVSELIRKQNAHSGIEHLFKAIGRPIKSINNTMSDKVSESDDAEIDNNNVDDAINAMFGSTSDPFNPSDQEKNDSVLQNTHTPIFRPNTPVIEHYINSKNPGDDNQEMEDWIKNQKWQKSSVSFKLTPEIDELFDYDDHFDRIIHIDIDTVNNYINCINNGIELEPIIVGKSFDDGKISIIDGNHRAYAYKMLEIDMPVFITDKVLEEVNAVDLNTLTKSENATIISEDISEKDEFLAPNTAISNTEDDINDEELDDILKILKI